MGPEATNMCQYDQLCSRLKAGIGGAVHGVQYIWDANSSTKIAYFFLWMQKLLQWYQLIWNASDILQFIDVQSSFVVFVVNATGRPLSWKKGMWRPVFCTLGRAWHRETQFPWSRMILTFSCWSNAWKQILLKSPSPGKLTMLVHLIRSQIFSYILIR